VLVHAFNWKKMSVAAALAFRWDGKRSRLFFRMKPDSYDSESLIDFLRDLRRDVRGKKCILIWDGLAAHKSKDMKTYLARQTSWLSIEQLPGYAPDLNPVEPLWGNIKRLELANRCAVDLGESCRAVCRGMARVRRRTGLAFAFLKHAGLSF
jgi:putative transposase